MSTVIALENVEVEVKGFPRRQAETLAWTALGLTSKEAARRMGISHRTVEMNLKHVCLRLDAHNRTHLITQALAAGCMAVRDTAAAAALVCVLSMASLPAQDLGQTDWARLQVRQLRTRRDELLDTALPLAA